MSGRARAHTWGSGDAGESSVIRRASCPCHNSRRNSCRESRIQMDLTEDVDVKALLSKVRRHDKEWRTAADKQLEWEKQHPKSARCILVPSTVSSVVWNAIIVTLVCFSAVFAPVDIAFSLGAKSGAVRGGNTFVDFVFLADVAVSFRTAYVTMEYNDEHVVKQPWLIAKRYLRTWFVVDLIAALP